MADAARTVEVIFAGTDNLSEVIDGVGAGLSTLHGGVEVAAEKLADLAKSLATTDAALIALGATLVSVGVDSAGKFEDSFDNVATLLGTDAEAIKTLKADLLSFSQSSTKSLDEITSATFEAISAGVKWEQSLEFLAIAEKTAVGGSTDLKTAVDGLTTAVNATGVGYSETERVSDIFFETMKAGKTTIGELSAVVGDVLPVARQLGIDFETVGASLATLTANGLSTSAAATQLNALFSAMLAPAKGAKDAADELGLALGASAVESNGFTKTLDDMIKATGGDVEALKGLVGSQEALKAAVTIGISSNEKFTSTLHDIKNAANSTEIAFEQFADSFAGANQKLANNLQTVFIGIGDPLLVTYSQLTEAASTLLGALSEELTKTESVFQPVFDALKATGADVAFFIEDLAAALPEALEGLDFSGFIDSFRNLFGEIGGLFDEFTQATFELDSQTLTEKIQLIIDTFTNLNNTVAEIVKALGPTFDLLGEGLLLVTNANDEVVRSFGDLLGKAVVIDQFGTLVGGIFLSFQEAGISTKDAVDLVTESFDLLSLEAQLAFQEIIGATAGAVSAILTAIDGIPFVFLGEASVDFAREMRDLQLEAGEASRALASDVEQAVAAFEDEREVLDRFLEGARTVALEIGQDVLTVTEAVKDTFASTNEAAKNLGSVEFNVWNTNDVIVLEDMTTQLGEFLGVVSDPGFPKADDDLQAIKRTVESGIDASSAISSVLEFNDTLVITQDELVTVKTLTDLARTGDFTNLDTSAINDATKGELEYRFTSLESQVDLVAALTEVVKEQRETLEARQESEGVNVTFEAANFQQPLETMMTEIIDTFQVKAAAEGATSLFGQ